MYRIAAAVSRTRDDMQRFKETSKRCKLILEARNLKPKTHKTRFKNNAPANEDAAY